MAAPTFSAGANLRVSTAPSVIRSLPQSAMKPPQSNPQTNKDFCVFIILFDAILGAWTKEDRVRVAIEQACAEYLHLLIWIIYEDRTSRPDYSMYYYKTKFGTTVIQKSRIF